MERLENDMDDLFQKAGELYPLKTTGSDWDAVAGKLQNENPGEVHDLTGSAAIRNRRKTWLLLLLLIPMGIGVYYFSGNMNREHQNAVSAKPLSGSVNQNKINPVIPDNQSVPATTAENIKADHNKTAASDESQSIPGKKNDSEDGSMKSTLSNKNKGLVYAAGGGKQLTSNHMPDAQKQITPAGNKTNARRPSSVYIPGLSAERSLAPDSG